MFLKYDSWNIVKGKNNQKWPLLNLDQVQL
jgi:hypothetical protein